LVASGGLLRLLRWPVRSQTLIRLPAARGLAACRLAAARRARGGVLLVYIPSRLFLCVFAVQLLLICHPPQDVILHPANRSDFHPADTCFARTTPQSGIRPGGRFSIVLTANYLRYLTLFGQTAFPIHEILCRARLQGDSAWTFRFSFLEIPVCETGSVATIRRS